jgi:hypothetical protein
MSDDDLIRRMDADLAMRIAVEMEVHAAIGTTTKAKADAILALINNTGKEVSEGTRMMTEKSQLQGAKSAYFADLSILAKVSLAMDNECVPVGVQGIVIKALRDAGVLK